MYSFYVLHCACEQRGPFVERHKEAIHLCVPVHGTLNIFGWLIDVVWRMPNVYSYRMGQRIYYVPDWERAPLKQRGFVWYCLPEKGGGDVECKLEVNPENIHFSKVFSRKRVFWREEGVNPEETTVKVFSKWSSVGTFNFRSDWR